MRLFLVGCIALFLLVIITAAIKTRSTKHSASRKPKQKRKKLARSLASKPLENWFDEKASIGEAAGELLDADQALGFTPTESQSAEKPVEPVEQEVKPQKVVTTDVRQYVVLHVMAPTNAVFSGYELLQALLANGLRYGKDKVFHRHEHKSGLGNVLFSLASVNRPGTFDLPNMANFSCPGLTLFLVLKDVDEPLKVFDLMFETAKGIVDDLGGEVWSEQRKPLQVDEVSKIRAEIEQYFETTRAPDCFVDA